MKDAEWRDRAACRNRPPEWWFPEPEIPGRRIPVEAYAQAETFCGVCPVRLECLAYANNTNQSGGMWGGLRPDERRTFRAKHGHYRRCRWCDEPFHLGPRDHRTEYCCDDHRDRANRQRGWLEVTPTKGHEGEPWPDRVEPWREAAADAAFETGAALSMSPYS